MSRPNQTRRRVLVAAPLVVALACAVLVLVSRNQSEGAGFCAAYQAALTDTIQRSGPISGSPSPDDAVRLFSAIDIDAIRSETPADLREPVDRLAEELPKLRQQLAALPPDASAIALVSPDMLKDVETLGNAFGKRCQ